MPTRREVAQFLNEFKAAVTLGHIRWLRRPTGRQHLDGLEITCDQALELIKGLTPDSYSQGPMPDDMKPDRDVWVFGHDIGGTKAYIKLALQPDDEKRHVVHGCIWSFHDADHPMSYPLRGQTK